MKFADRIASRLALAAVLLVAALPAAAAPKGNTVNINAADASQLALLPRVGPSVAQRIIDYRKKNGPFKSADDLMLVQGIGEKTYQLIKPYVATAGETTLKEKVKAGRASSDKASDKPEKGSDKASDKTKGAGKESSR
jgi:competence protein ComEA